MANTDACHYYAMRRGLIFAAVVAPAAIAVGLLLALPPAGAELSTVRRTGPSEAATSTTLPADETRLMTCEPGVPPDFRPICTQTKQIDMYTPPRSNWPLFLAALGWILIPLLLAAYIADSRDESLVIAVVLTLVLGWIGLALVFAFLGRSRRNDVAPRLDA